MQTDDRKLTQRAKAWAAAIHAQFEGVPVSTSIEVPKPTVSAKMY
jgi:hypothetical protein